MTVLESGLFEPPTSATAWPLLDPEYLLHFRPWRHIGFDGFFRNFLVRPESVSHAPFWHLFWALTESAHRFVTRYIQFWSHEERLTGHLITEMARAAEGSTEQFDSSLLRGRVKFYYADVAAGSMEAKTGADFAIIVQVATEDGGEVFKVARFQAKKVGPSGSARMDVVQLCTLRKENALGYYVFYYAPDGRSRLLPPSVVPAVQVNLDDKERKQSITWDARSSACDLATFIVFALADIESAHGVVATSAREAAQIALGGGNHELERPGRALVLSVGGITDPNWRQLFGGDEAFGPRDEAQ